MNHEQTLLPLIKWIEDCGHLAISFGTMLETARIPAPGDLIITVGGAVLGAVLGAILGAILRDKIGYLPGATGGRPLVLKVVRPFGGNEAMMTAAERAFAGRADRGAFPGRCVSISRIFAGPMGGIVHMPYHEGVFFNAGGAIGCVAVVAGLSYAFSGNLELILWVLGHPGYVGLAVFSCVVGFCLSCRHRRRHSKA